MDPGGDGSDFVPCMIPQLELFQKKGVQTCITGRSVEKIKPLTSLQSHSDVLEFLCSGRPLSFMDICNVQLRLVLHMQKKNGSPLAATDISVSVADLLLHSLFSQCEVFLNERPVTPSPHYYNYKSYLDLATSATPDAVQTQLQTLLFIPDDQPASANGSAAWTARQKPFLQSKRVELIGKVRADIMNIVNGLYLLDNVSLRIRFTLAPQNFFLWSKSQNADAQIVIDEAQLLVPFMFVNPELSLGIEKYLLQHNAVYRYKSTQVKVFIHPPNTEVISCPISFSGKLPTNFLLTFIKTTDMSGDILSNPYNLQHFNCKEIQVFVNGTERKYEMDFDTTVGCSSVLRTLYNELGFDDESTSANLFTIDGLRNGRFAVGCDLTVDHSGGYRSQNLDLHGTVRIQARLGNVVSHSIAVILFAEYDTQMEITASREVVML